MKNLKIIAQTILIVLLASSILVAGNESRIGTTGAEQVNIPVGAKSIATGGAFVSNLTGVESLYWNPAGLDRSGRTEAMFSYMNYIADINLSYLAVSGSVGDLGSIALSIKSLDIGEIQETTVENPTGTGASFSPGFLVAGLTYSKMITDRISGGTTIKVISESIMDQSAFGVAVDIGTQYHFANNISIGVILKNIGTNMRFTGGDLEQRAPVEGAPPTSNEGFFQAVTDNFGIPSQFEIGIAYKYEMGTNNAITLGGNFVNQNEAENNIRLGAEYNIANILYLRGGYDMVTESSNVRSDENIFGLSLGGGLSYSFKDFDLEFDYAFRDVDVFDSNHVFTFKVGFGAGK